MLESDPSPTASEPPSSLVLYLALVVATFCISTAAVLIRLVPAPASAIAFWRLAIATTLLMPGVVKSPTLRPAKPHIGLIFAAGVFLAAHFVTWIASLTLIPVAVSTALVSCHPLFVTLYERIVHHRQLPRQTLIGGSLTLVGVAIMAVRSGVGHLNPWGVGLAFLGAFFQAGYLIWGSRVRQSLSTTLYSPSVYMVAMALLFGLQMVRFHTIGPLSGRILILYILIALLPTLGGHTLFQWLLRYLPTSTVSLAFLGEIAGAALLAWAVLGQAPTVSDIVAIVCIMLGLAVTVGKPLHIRHQVM